MISITPYLSLIKPDTSEFYDVNVFNSNMDKIDTEIKKLNGWRIYNSVTELGLTDSTVTPKIIHTAMPAKSILIADLDVANSNIPYSFRTIYAIKLTAEHTNFEVLDKAFTNNRSTGTYYSFSDTFKGWHQLSYAVPKTETVIQSGFLTGFSGYVAYSVNQEGEKTVQLNMTKSSDMTTGSTTFYTLTAVKPKRNVYKTVNLMDGSGNYIAGCYAYVLYDTNGVLLIYVTGTVTNARNFSCVLKFD